MDKKVIEQNMDTVGYLEEKDELSALLNRYVRKKDDDKFLPKNYEQLKNFCNVLAKSYYIPKNFIGKPENILAAVLMGSELGLKPMQSLTCIAVVNGRPTIWGDMALALCQKSPSFVDIIETLDPEKMIATCTVKRKGRTDVTTTFSLEEAKVAGLLGRDTPWKAYPKRMLKMRARGFSLRDMFPDVLTGIITTEEARDIPIDIIPDTVPDTGNSTTLPETKKDEEVVHSKGVSKLKLVDSKKKSPAIDKKEEGPSKTEELLHKSDHEKQLLFYKNLKNNIGIKDVDFYLKMRGVDPEKDRPYLAQVYKNPEGFRQAVENYVKACSEATE